jgi:hypothetical protein
MTPRSAIAVLIVLGLGADPSRADLVETSLSLPPNEASGLLAAHPEVAGALGFVDAYWVALDEPDKDPSRLLAVVGRRGDGVWLALRVRVEVASQTRSAPAPDDPESLARHASWVYVFGSHFGRKAGPLQAKRHFVARFRERDAVLARGAARIPLHVRGGDFRLHRTINDALEASAIDLAKPTPRETAAYLKDGVIAASGGRVRRADWPLNIEGAAVGPDGALWLGLRIPNTRAGDAIVLKTTGVGSLFGDRGRFRVEQVIPLLGTGETGAPTGVRSLHFEGDVLHAIVGNLDSSSKSVVVQENEGGARRKSEHWTWSAAAPTATRVRTLGDRRKVEGLARTPSDGWLYAVDDEDVIRLLESTR